MPPSAFTTAAAVCFCGRRLRARSILALAALLVFAAEARQSVGYFNFDEYCHPIEFASYKLGLTPASELNPEFGFRMRPFLQPAAYALVARGLSAAGLEDPGAALLAFRLGGALFAWAALCLLAAALARRLPGEADRTKLFAACLLAWYLPFLSVRTSQENLSGSLLAVGLALFLLLERRPALAALSAGLALGLSFDVRYQSVLAAAGFLGWLALVRRPGARGVAAFAGGFLAAVALGLAVDAWGYGAWTLTPWNYVRVNLLEGRADQFGRFPVTYYLVQLLVAHPPLSALLLAAAVLFFVRAPKDPITWLAVPFLAGHTLLAHKELRFLFPLGPLAAAIPPLLLFDPAIRLEGLRGWLARHRAATVGVVALNFAFLGALLLVPVRHDLSVQIALRRDLEREPDAEVVLLKGARLSEPCPVVFLRPRGFSPKSAATWSEVSELVRGTERPVRVVARLADLPPEPFREAHRPRLVAAPLPEGVARLLARPIGRTEMLALWSLEKRPLAGAARSGEKGL